MPPRTTSSPRPLAAAALVVVLACLALLAADGTALAADGGDVEATIAARLADERARAGVGAVRRSSDLDAVARDWSRRQAADGEMKHNPSLAEQVRPAEAWYENVGHVRGIPTGEAGARLHAMWMDSDGHRANILRSPLTDVGIGVAVSGDAIYATVVFRDSGEAPAEPSPSPDPPASSEEPAADDAATSPETDEEPAPRATTASTPEPAPEPEPEPQPDPSPSPTATAEPEPDPTPSEDETTDEPSATRDQPPGDLAARLDRRTGTSHGDEPVSLDELPDPPEGVGRPPVELGSAPQAAELQVTEDTTRAVPLVFGLTTLAAAGVIGAGRSRREGR